jgi:hypothetical protein
MGEGLRSTDGMMLPAVLEAIDALEVDDIDAGVVRLAKAYAESIDHGRCFHCDSKLSVLESLGPKLLAALEQLGATPAARAKLKGGGAQRGDNRLTALRAAR